MAAESTLRRRTGGRSATVLASIRKAVEELIAERGSDAITVPMVAVGLPARSGGAFSGDDVMDRVVAPIIYRVIFLPWTLSEIDAQAYWKGERARGLPRG
ncbi:hypothetical protein AB0D57_20325 [Streptomyces sp. NPDC048275]|uniref:hypothetical protein n=1 Tax=Streptomyces sp. NPDC048275 TaxID=3155629 RepID=UPI0033EA72F6